MVKRITEKKMGRTSIFIMDEYYDDTLMWSTTINVEPAIVELKDKKIYMLYDSEQNLIENAYDFLNKRGKRESENTLRNRMYTLKYLYAYSEIIEIPIEEFNKKHLIGFVQFLIGDSSVGGEYEFDLLTKRDEKSIGLMLSVIRLYYDYLQLKQYTILQERAFNRYSTSGHKKYANSVVPKFISSEQFEDIIEYIQNEIKPKERRLRDECIVRLMYESGCRLGEVLGSTLEDYSLIQENGEYRGKLIIRNRVTDNNCQKAKTCKNVDSKSDYNTSGYKELGRGYQFVTFSSDLYELLMKYQDTAHVISKKKKGKLYKNYERNSEADAVGTFKSSHKKNFYMFLNYRKEPLLSMGWNKELKVIFEHVGIYVDRNYKSTNLSHRFRHGFIMNLIYVDKMPISLVKYKSRHKNESSLEKYNNPTARQIADHYKRMSR